VYNFFGDTVYAYVCVCARARAFTRTSVSNTNGGNNVHNSSVNFVTKCRFECRHTDDKNMNRDFR